MKELVFTDLWFDLSNKEKATVLYGVKNYAVGYSNIHLGQLPFLQRKVVVGVLTHLEMLTTKKEKAKQKTPMRSKIIRGILNKLETDWNCDIIVLDQAKVISRIRTLLTKERHTNLYVTYVHVRSGRVRTKVELRPTVKKDYFELTARKIYFKEAVEQLTYKYGAYNN